MKKKLELKLLRIKGNGTNTKRGYIYPVLSLQKFADGMVILTLKGENDSRPIVDGYCVGDVFEWVA